MTVAAPSQPLAEALAAVPSPAAVLDWLDQPHIRDLLTCLAAGKLALTHEALDGWPRPRAVFYLRDLLVSCGALPAADKQLREFQAWLDRRLENLAGHPHLRLLRQFGLWHQLPAMRARAAGGPLRTTAAQYARSRFIQAQAFLTWTDALGVRPSALTQAHIDAYYASHASHQREGVRAFLVWAAGHGHIPGHLDSPRQQPYTGQVITQQRRLDLLRRFATDEAIPIRTRPDLRAAATRPAGSRPRHRRRPRLPPHHHHPPARQGSRTVEPVRRRRPRTLITPGAGPYRPGCGQDRTASRIGPRRNPLRLARATGTRLSVCAAASASRSTPNCQDSRSSAAPGHSLSAIQRSMSSQVLGRVSAGSAQAASSISVMMYPGAS